ncbi:hypothetical protein SCLCIDRAFT_1212749 [Scleroderma citrinum Foug A]|uniref:Leucine-rich repeat-containing protein n=1 Tax=Scleroderma citrinum Foug A TaxID=1036808 RepID=A0A0C3E9N0_9AGAM|nr:hypothetical protein SCLCIDRAFT_1212749 [Scleroderma citrinum Foug A]
MQVESGDVCLRRVAAFIRDNEKSLAEAAHVRYRRLQQRQSWFATQPSPLALTVDTHRLFYILIRLESVGFNVGSLDVTVENPSKPMHYTHIHVDKSDALSLSSLRSSLSAVSGLSRWWTRPEQHPIDAELKYIYSSFTKLPALSIKPPGPTLIQELANDPPIHSAIPLDAFKNLQSLYCSDIDPRSILGWDRLADGLRTLSISRSGIVDVSDILISAVLDDQSRRNGTSISHRKRLISAIRLPPSVPEEDSPLTYSPLSLYKWSLLRHLSLADNALTFFPSDPLPYLVSLTHLDLSSNLFVSVPHGLSVLHNLVSLNLADNMIDSVLGVYTQLGQVLHLNLSRNRLESICGLERLLALEKVDLRSNHIDESAEIGRLATLPNIAELWIEGNPLTDIEDGYRVACFDLFHKEGKSITLDGTPPSVVEKMSLTPLPPVQMSSTRSATATAAAPPPSQESPPPEPHTPLGSRAVSPVASAGVMGKQRRRKAKRIVDLDENESPAPQLPADARVLTSPRIPSPLSPKGSHRRSYSLFEPPDTTPETESQSQLREAEMYRARIESLRSDMGEGWLKVFSQSQVSSPAAG